MVGSGADNVVSVAVSVDPAWLADPARKFPVTIDPSLYLFTDPGAVGNVDTMISSAAPTTSYATDPYLMLGNAGGATSPGRCCGSTWPPSSPPRRTSR